MSIACSCESSRSGVSSDVVALLQTNRTHILAVSEVLRNLGRTLLGAVVGPFADELSSTPCPAGRLVRGAPLVPGNLARWLLSNR